LADVIGISCKLCQICVGKLWMRTPRGPAMAHDTGIFVNDNAMNLANINTPYVGNFWTRVWHPIHLWLVIVEWCLKIFSLSKKVKPSVNVLKLFGHSSSLKLEKNKLECLSVTFYRLFYYFWARPKACHWSEARQRVWSTAWVGSSLTRKH